MANMHVLSSYSKIATIHLRQPRVLELFIASTHLVPKFRLISVLYNDMAILGRLQAGWLGDKADSPEYDI